MSCPICLERLVPASDSENVVCTPCGHLFHESCLTGVTNSSVRFGDSLGVCPTCRSPIPTSGPHRESGSTDNAQNGSRPAIRRVYMSASDEHSGNGDVASARAQRLRAREAALEWEDERRYFTGALAAAEAEVKALEGYRAETRRLRAQLAETQQRLQNLEQKQRRSLQQLMATSNAIREERALRLASQAALKVFLEEAEQKEREAEVAKQQERRASLGGTLRRGLGGLFERKKKPEQTWPTVLSVEDNAKLPASQFSPRVTARLVELRRSDGSEMNIYVSAS